MTEHTFWQDVFDIFKKSDNLFRSETLEATTTASGQTRLYRTGVDDKEMVISIDVPGVKPEAVSVEAVGQTLVVGYPKGTHRFTIRPEFDINAVKATLELGVLELRMPKRTAPQGTKVKIEVK
jgi:HSP20 family molecular chaperone IbpA